MAVSYAMAVLGFIFNMADSISSVVGTDDFKARLPDLVGGDAKVVGRWLMVISIIVMIARLRSIIGWGDRKRDE